MRCGEEGLDEVDAFTLIGRRKRAAAPTTDHARLVQPHALRRMRTQYRATFESSDGLAAQEARQFDPLGASDARAPLYELCRHYVAYRSRRCRQVAVRHHPYMQPGLSYRMQPDGCPGIRPHSWVLSVWKDPRTP